MTVTPQRTDHVTRFGCPMDPKAIALPCGENALVSLTVAVVLQNVMVMKFTQRVCQMILLRRLQHHQRPRNVSSAMIEVRKQ